MSRQGINTGTSPNDGLGDSLLTGAIKINSNFSEIYNAFGDGNTLSPITGYANTAGIATYAVTAGVSTYASISGYSTSSGVSTTATKLETPRTISITGDVVGAAVTFDGAGNVSIAATIQPNSVALGTDTTGDYVQSISGTSNQITVTSGTGEGSTPILSIPSQFTAPQDVTVTRDLQVNRNLNVTGNITIGGTSATLFTTELKVSDPDLVLGFRTDGSNNDISNDTTANHGGIAIASTEGTPLISLYDVGVGETNPPTYKKIMWFKSGTFSGLGTDAWLFNYAVGIGSTQVPNGVRLAAGGMQVTDSTISTPQLNISGVSTFQGNINLGDNDFAYFGDAGDLYIGHNGSVSAIADTGTGDLYIAGDNSLIVTDLSYTENKAKFNTNGSVELYYDNVKTFETLGTGVTITGTTFTNQLNVSGVVTATSFVGNGSGLTDVPGSGLNPIAISGRYYFPWGMFPDTAGTRVVTSGRVYYYAFVCTKTTTWTRIGTRISSGVTGTARLGIYAVGSTGLPTTLLQDFGTVSTSISGEKEITISYQMNPGTYYLALVSSAAATFTGYFLDERFMTFMYGLSSPTVTVATSLWYETSSGDTLPSTANTTLTAEDTSLRRPQIFLRVV